MCGLVEEGEPKMVINLVSTSHRDARLPVRQPPCSTTDPATPRRLHNTYGNSHFGTLCRKHWQELERVALQRQWPKLRKQLSPASTIERCALNLGEFHVAPSEPCGDSEVVGIEGLRGSKSRPTQQGEL